MNKRWWMAVILAAALSAASFAQTTNVYSRNAVGVIRMDVPTNRWALFSYQLESMGPSNRVGDVLGTNIPSGTVVLFFNGTRYISEEFYPGYGWWPGTNTLPRGSGFWIRSPAGFTLYVSGEVPSASNTLVQLRQGYSLVSFPYPVETPISNSVLNAIGEANDVVLRYTGSGYEAAEFYPGWGWWPPTFMLKVGEGYWYRSASTKTWSEVKTKYYTYP